MMNSVALLAFGMIQLAGFRIPRTAFLACFVLFLAATRLPQAWATDGGPIRFFIVTSAAGERPLQNDELKGIEVWPTTHNGNLKYLKTESLARRGWKLSVKAVLSTSATPPPGAEAILWLALPSTPSAGDLTTARATAVSALTVRWNDMGRASLVLYADGQEKDEKGLGQFASPRAIELIIQISYMNNRLSVQVNGKNPVLAASAQALSRKPQFLTWGAPVNQAPPLPVVFEISNKGAHYLDAPVNTRAGATSGSRSSGSNETGAAGTRTPGSVAGEGVVTQQRLPWYFWIFPPFTVSVVLVGGAFYINRRLRPLLKGIQDVQRSTQAVEAAIEAKASHRDLEIANNDRRELETQTLSALAKQNERINKLHGRSNPDVQVDSLSRRMDKIDTAISEIRRMLDGKDGIQQSLAHLSPLVTAKGQLPNLAELQARVDHLRARIEEVALLWNRQTMEQFQQSAEKFERRFRQADQSIVKLEQWAARQTSGSGQQSAVAQKDVSRQQSVAAQLSVTREQSTSNQQAVSTETGVHRHQETAAGHEHHSKQATPMPPRSQSESWENRWQMLRVMLGQAVTAANQETLGRDLDDADDRFEFLVTEWKRHVELGPVKVARAKWTYYLSVLDAPLLRPFDPQTMGDGSLTGSTLDAMRELRRIIEDAQRERQMQLRSMGVERIEGQPGVTRDNEDPSRFQSDEDEPAYTDKPELVGTLCDIPPGKGGYMWEGEVLSRAQARFYQLKPSED